MTGILRRELAAVDGTGRLSRPWYNALIQTQQNADGLISGATLYTDTGVVNAMVIASGLSGGLTRGLTRYVKPAFTNTSITVTLNDSKSGNKAVVLGDGSAPAVGQIQAGVTLQLQYDGAQWEIVNLSTASQTIPGNLTVGGTLIASANETVAGTLQVTGLTLLKTVDSTVVDDLNTALAIGFKGRPQVIKNANATTVMADRSKHWYHSDGVAYTWTIDSNANVPYPIGTEIDFVCKATGAFNITLAITADTLVWLPTGATGSRTLAQYARARALKVASTTWVLDGVGIT